MISNKLAYPVQVSGIGFRAKHRTGVNSDPEHKFDRFGFKCRFLLPFEFIKKKLYTSKSK